jgi:tRNA uridine 5-carbamoylmethylation protein Kti12
MTQLVICRGLPGSGKTSWTRDQLTAVAAEGRRGRLVRSNRDDYRAMMFDYRYRGAPLRPIEDLVTIAQHTAIRGLLRAGVDVICDDTNLRESVVVGLAVLAESVGAAWRVEDFTHIPLETCIARDRSRAIGGRGNEYVGRDVITAMYDKYSPGGWDPMPIPELTVGGTQ